MFWKQMKTEHAHLCLYLFLIREKYQREKKRENFNRPGFL